MDVTALLDALQVQAIGCPVEVQTEHGWLLVMSWETGRLHRLLATHERELRLPEWALPDFDVIAGRRFPLPITPPEPPTSTAGTHAPTASSTARLEDVLRALGAAGCRPMPGTEGRWRSLCPLCMLRGRVDRRVLVSYQPTTATARLHCFSTGHSGAELRAALGLYRRRPVELWGEAVSA